MGGTVDHVFEGMTCDHVRVVDEYGPTIDEDKHDYVEVMLEGKDHDEEVVRDWLGEAVDEVEGVGSVWSWDDPFVVRFVKVFVQEWKMQPPMYPVDAIIGK